MSLKMIVQDIQIGYYQMMSRIAQSQRKNSPMINRVHIDSIELSISKNNEMSILNAQIEKSEYEQKSSVVA